MAGASGVTRARSSEGESGATDVSRPAPANRLALAAYGLSTFFAFPHEIPFAAALPGPDVVDAGLLVTWIVPAALVAGIRELEPARAAKTAFVASFLAHTAFFYWFLVVTMVYAGMPFVLGILAPLVPALYVAPFTAIFAWGWRRAGLEGPAAIVFGGALWVALDWARGHFLGGFPWATLGYGLHLDAPLLGLTRFGGVYALSFVAAAVGIALARWWARRDGGTARDLVATLLLGVVLHALGAFALSDAGVETRAVRVAAIQGNVDQGEKWDAARREAILATYLQLSEQAGEAGAEWIVWPETAVPGLVENDPELRRRLAALAARYEATLVVGGMGVDIDWDAGRFSAFYDSAFLFDPDGRLEDRYDKTHLVPFGEYVPLRGLVGRFLQGLATGLSSNDVTPGARPRNLGLRRAPGAEPRQLVGVPICYELLFPDLVRRMGGEGATALLAITNDAWYGRTGAPHQFLAMTALRAAENGLPTVRAANTGVSALIDARGRVQQRSALFEEAIVVGEIAQRLGGEPTFYARHGDLFAWLCGLGSVCVLAGAHVASRKRFEERNENSPPRD